MGWGCFYIGYKTVLDHVVPPAVPNQNRHPAVDFEQLPQTPFRAGKVHIRCKYVWVWKIIS